MFTFVKLSVDWNHSGSPGVSLGWVPRIDNSRQLISCKYNNGFVLPLYLLNEQHQQNNNLKNKGLTKFNKSQIPD